MALSAAISRTKLFSQAFHNIYNLINTRSNIPDPLGGSSRTMVYKREPDAKGGSFKGYPFIIIYPVNASLSKFTVGNKKAELVYEFDVEVRSSNRMLRPHDGKGAEYLDEISDALYATLDSKTNKDTLREYGMYNLIVNTESTDVVDVYQERIYVRRFRVVFTQMMTVSA